MHNDKLYSTLLYWMHRSHHSSGSDGHLLRNKDLFFTILSVKNIGVISGSEWTTIGNHMRSLGYGFTNEGCRQHFQGLRRAQHKSDIPGPNGDTVRRNDPTMNPITRRPGPGRGRPRKQPPVPVPGAPGEGAPHPPLALGIDHGPPPNSAPPYPQGAQSYDPTPAGHQPTHPQQVQAAMRPGTISSAPPTPQASTPGNAVPGPGPVTYPSPNLTPALPQNPPHLHPLQHGQPGQSGQPGQQPQQPQPEQQSQSDQQSQPDQQPQQPQPQQTQPQSAQQSQPGQQPNPTTQPQPQPQPDQEIQHDYQSQELPQEPPQETREATDTDAISQSQPQPIEQNHEPHAILPQEQLQPEHEDIDADGDADGEVDVDNDEPSAKRQRMGSPEPAKDDDMDDEAVLALAAHSGPTDFASDDWDNADFLLDLVVGLYTGAQTNKGLTPAIKESIEEYLKTRGYTTSFDAVRQHVQKLRKNRDTAAIQNAGSDTATPRKARATAPKTPKRAPKRKAPAKSASIADDDEDLEDMKMQLKMEDADADDGDLLSPKGAKRARNVTPKAEPDADDEGDSGEA
ncbi:unnamed protein product [Fusarium graminearum]|uniref:Uncharacterized protein n=1 Tax=Gibberella zeae TaxID=5518 RepID=A0A4E9DMW3_GIBZA|nr:unnamed protein product [Fusarium graminearum]